MIAFSPAVSAGLRLLSTIEASHWRIFKCTVLIDSVARENQDTACLNFALSWLLYLRQAHPQNSTFSFSSLARLVGGGSTEQDEIAYLKTKAREGKHWSLMSSTLLEEAKGQIYSVSCLLAKLQVNVTQSFRC